ncbi:MAG TPA: hypothetical protein VFR85_12905, partial [Anaeromyxobacteraceae bacterium]|nr:hypothetical protein [Anaeromyxobacteraceae bacterium]
MTTRAPGRLIPLAGLWLCLAACAAGTEEVSQAGSLQVVNGTTYAIAELYVSPAGAGTWGPDQLASPIAPSGTFTLTGIAASSYDFMAIASNGITFWQTSSVSITAGGAATWTLLQP